MAGPSRAFVSGRSPAAVEVPSPEPGPHEVLVRVRAVSLNHRDLLNAEGTFGDPPRAGLVPCSDCCGEVVALGAEADRFWVGDRVAPIFFQRWTTGPFTREAAGSGLGGALDGVLAEYVCLPETGLVHVPAHLSLAEAATLPCAALTAWNALFTRGHLIPGQTVLVLGSGGVSVFVLQFARAAGADVIATTGSDAKMERLASLGARTCINYRRSPAWDEAVLEATDGRGVDHVIEVGGPTTLERSIRALAYGGHVALIGGAAGYHGACDPMGLTLKNAQVSCLFVGSRDHFEAMNRALAIWALHPVIDSTFAFDEVPVAYAYLKSGAHVGKVVIEIATDSA